jgi:hypothetical protein
VTEARRLDECESEALPAIVRQATLGFGLIHYRLGKTRAASLPLASIHDHLDLGRPVEESKEEGQGLGPPAADHQRGKTGEVLAQRADLANPVGQGGIREWFLCPHVPLAPRADRNHHVTSVSSSTIVLGC